MTALFEKTESRGEDAAGVWGTEPGEKGKIIYHKQPGKSSEFVETDIWKRVRRLKPDLLLLHARAASFGVGSPKINKNNHPFVNSDCTTALIHNGRVPDLEYNFLKKQYEVESECDSEMFLRVFEHQGDLKGIEDIWSYMYRSHMAVAIGQRLGTDRQLWLFRNDQRPIWVTDMRQELGQVFFFSDPDIWDDATSSCKSMWPYLGKVKMIAVPTETIWRLSCNAKGEVGLKKFKVSLKEATPWQANGTKVEIKKLNSEVKVISRLDENEDVIQPKVAPKASRLDDDLCLPAWKGDELFPDLTDSKQNQVMLNEACSEIRRLLGDVEVAAENMMWETNLADNDVSDLLTSLQGITLELQGNLRLLEARH